MLVLSRKIGQQVTMTTESGEQIVITVKKDPGPGLCRLAIEAPRSVVIVRSELLTTDDPGSEPV